MRRNSVGIKLYVCVLAVFAVFAVSFIIFQQSREKHYRTGLLDTKLQDYNARMAESLAYAGCAPDEAAREYVGRHHVDGLRVTLTDTSGRVLYDNMRRKYGRMESHADRNEIKDALKYGRGMNISRMSSTMNHDYFYSATYFPRQGIVIRTALPYDNNLLRSLRSDSRYVWFAATAMLVLIAVLYRFVSRLGTNINKLRIFARRAAAGESLDIEDLAAFPGDELGEIAERIVKIYRQLESTRKEQDELKRQLTQNMAHELKTPVASILGYMETIAGNPGMDADMRMQFVCRCKAQAERLTMLLGDISVLNRLDEAPGMIGFETVDVSSVVSDIEAETAQMLSARGMTFSNLLPRGIVVRGNRSLVYSIFRNLTDNAIAYSGHGTAVTLSAEETDAKWTFTFSDNGCGVPDIHLPRIFERFYRVDKGRSRKMGGTGLGLAIVKNAVLLHGGTICARPAPGGGLSFVFSIMKNGKWEIKN